METLSDDKFCSLDMLAEVASATLENDPELVSSAQQPAKHSNKANCSSSPKKSNGSELLNFDQIKSLSEKMLIEMFSELSCDEIRKNYSFKCFLMPDRCTQIFKSFGNETRARFKIKAHLLSHIKDLAEEANENGSITFLAEPLHVRNKRLKAENYKSECKSYNLSPKCTGRKPPIVIPTPPFPYVYIPLLPHIAEIAEVGNATICSKCGNSFDDGNHENYTKVNNNSNSPATIDNVSYYNLSNFLPSDENDPDSEDESILSDSFLNEVVYEDGVIHEICRSKCHEISSQIPVCFDDLKPDCPENLQACEKKLALKYIRGLRTKKKEERGPLTCQICKNKSFTAQATLMYHYRSHAGIKPFSCSVCEATFTRQHSLNYHMLIHDNKSRFMCSDCGRNFRHPSHYKEHLRRHTGETPYECTDCDLRFKTRNTYKRHLKTRHGKILTAQGIRLLSIEEFYKVRTSPRRKTPKSPPINLKDQETQWSENMMVPNDSTDSENELW
ncbi:zinc finger protein 43-like [Uloborus diversus]|uniref:zinc finger protein 43-like n=1 Tax=Uloborus diversus TaxID=327109 RepID=UPI00240A7189|nr:zinc finger protein 43-like [Uloborus diversus]